MLQQKKSQKGNWESIMVAKDSAPEPHVSYNKRNPKKGIERIFSTTTLTRPIKLLQQKKSQKGNWEFEVKFTVSPNISRMLQQKKSQKGNWEKYFSDFTLIHATSLQQKKSQKGNWEFARAVGEYLRVAGEVTTKEIPKRELREDRPDFAIHVCRVRVTTKEIPKRELRAQMWR